MARTDGEGGQEHQNTTLDLMRSLRDSNDGLSEIKTLQLDWTETDPEGIWDADQYKQALMRVQWAYDFLGQGALVISDRLHAHILSTIWGFDHVTLEEGSYGKLTHYHDTWLSACSSQVRISQSVEEAVNIAKQWYENGRTFS